MIESAPRLCLASGHLHPFAARLPHGDKLLELCAHRVSGALLRGDGRQMLLCATPAGGGGILLLKQRQALRGRSLQPRPQRLLHLLSSLELRRAERLHPPHKLFQSTLVGCGGRKVALQHALLVEGGGTLGCRFVQLRFECRAPRLEAHHINLQPL